VVLEAGRVIVDGDPRLATRTLRDDFETTRRAEQDLEQKDDPDVQARVTAVRVLDADGAVVSELAPGSDIRVQVDVEAASTLRDWVLGIGIDTPSGQSLYGTNTQLLGERMPAFSGRRTFELQLRNVGLGAGQYQMHGALAVWSGPEIHRLPQAATFNVEADGRSVGLLGASPTLVSS
jgi:ABC-2 type transport system ATP-binding protein